MALLKFYRGLVNTLPAQGVDGGIYITTDEGGIYLGTGTGMKRLGDFIQVDAVANLPTEGASVSALYYCVAENVLAKWNGTSWTQINKQRTKEELVTLLGLGDLAYLSEVGEDNLNSALKEKINAASGAQHTHDNKDVIDGITAAKVEAWDAAEQNAKDYADGLNTAMNTRVEALEAIDHTHGNKELLDTYTQTEANLADAVAKKHAHTFVESELNKIVDGDVAKWNTAAEKAHTHTFNETELNKIVEGDVAKWNGVAADHLTSEDKTALENAIKEAKKAGTDANTNIEAYKVTNDARVLAVEEDIAEITGEGGILAQAKSYSDGKLATARTEITAEIDADVKVVADELAGYKTSNDQALAGVKATVEAAATKEYTDAELAKKVDKVEGYSLISDSEIARLANVTNYDDTQVKADIAKKADAETMTTELGKKVDKVEGKSLVLDTEITKLAGVSEGANKVEGSEVNGKIKIDGVETVVYTHPEKHSISEVDGLQVALDGKQAAGDYSEVGHKHVKEDITDFTHTHVASEITDLDSTIKGYDYATKTELGNVDKKFENYKTAEAQKVIDDEQNRRLGVIEGDYLKAADIANFETKENVKKVADDLAGYIESNNAAVALKADKSVVEAMYTNEEIDAAILVETNRAKGVEESLQTQINTIMNNPDTEGVINSINEFTQYIADHGEIAEGFRTDIDKNKEDISTNAQAIAGEITRATGVEEALAGRIDVLEAGMGEHTHSWNDLTDRPFYEGEARSVVFEATDEAINNGVWINYGLYVKATDEVFSAEDLNGASVVMTTSYGDSEESIIIETIADGVVCGRLDDYSITVLSIASSEAAENAGLGYCEPGTYFAYVDSNYVSALKLAGTLKQLDEKFIPETIVRTEGLTTALGALKTSMANQDAVVLAEAQAYADQAEADAIAAAKVETETQVKALADGQVTTNKNDIAALLAQMTWGEF